MPFKSARCCKARLSRVRRYPEEMLPDACPKKSRMLLGLVVQKFSLTSSIDYPDTLLEAQGMTDDERAMQEDWERPVLNAVNAERVSLGREPVLRLTVALLREHLRSKLINGSKWRPGTRKRDALVQDYR